MFGKTTNRQSTRIKREKTTISAMVEIYCRGNHDRQGERLCGDCTEFLLYSLRRLDLCPFGRKKPTCGKCSIHCYKKGMQLRAKEIMRYAGPKMILYHPFMALRHILDGKRSATTTLTNHIGKSGQKTK